VLRITEPKRRHCSTLIHVEVHVAKRHTVISSVETQDV